MGVITSVIFSHINIISIVIVPARQPRPAANDSMLIHFLAYDHTSSVNGSIATSSAPLKLTRLSCCVMQRFGELNPGSTVILWTNHESHDVREACGAESRAHELVSLRRFGPAILRDTPLSTWRPHPGCRQYHGAEQMVDALRLAILYVHGGAYSDLDIIPLAPLTGIPSAAVTIQSPDGMINNSPLFFPAGHPCMHAVMEKMVNMSKARIGTCKFGAVGPALLQRLFFDHSTITSLLKRARYPWFSQYGPPAPSPFCNDDHVTVLPAHAFSPVLWQHSRRMFNSNEGDARTRDVLRFNLRVDWESRGVYAVHLWAKAAYTPAAGHHGSRTREANSLLEAIEAKCSL